MKYRVKTNGGSASGITKNALVAVAVLFSVGEVGEVRGQNTGKVKAAADELFFETQIRPLLSQNCFKCHGEEKQKGGLRLDSIHRILQGGDLGASLIPGNVKGSLMAKAIRWEAGEYAEETLEMPPKKKLSKDQIALLTKWIEMGAPWPQSAADIANSQKKIEDPRAGIWKAAAEHWAFQAVGHTVIPKDKNTGWGKNIIDRFVLAKMETGGLAPSAKADKITLLRRAYLDLIGLPPLPEEVEAFLKDSSAGAFSKAVEKLLKDRRYGERWGRHWLDVARYGDSKGAIFGETREYPYAYTFRDYVISSFNRDKPFDQFLIEQLAADQLGRKANDPSLAAMGFITVNRRSNGGGEVEQWADRVDTLGRGMLGLTIACARCHDHKYDPIPTADFYSLLGVFASSEEPKELPVIGRPKPGSYQDGEFKKFKAEEDRKLQEYKDKNHVRLLKQYRGQVGGFLMVLADGRGEKENALRVLAGRRKLSPYIALRYRDYLAEHENDPVFGAWQAFVTLEESGFAGKVKKLAALVTENKLPGVTLNPVVAEAFKGKAPATLKEVADIYQKIFTSVDKQWQEMVKKDSKSKSLADAPREQLRQLLYSSDAPGVLPAGDFKQLERKVYLELLKLNANYTLRLAMHPGSPRRAMVVRDKKELYDPHIFIRGNDKRPGDAVPRQFLKIIEGDERKPFSKGSGRLELAQAIASKDNPLTARVMVNRIWNYHFGQGLVNTPSDFGLRCEEPVQVELLNWLAREFMDKGWSIKHMHRLIMNSATYQQSSHGDPKKFAVDPDNNFLWRFNRRRLEFEAIHDSMLAVSGKLDSKVGGPAVTLIRDTTAKQGGASVTWGFNPYRRAVYGAVSRDKLPSLLLTFDFANPDETNEKRNSTTVPTQGLYMMNNPFVMELAAALVERKDVSVLTDPETRIRRIYQLTFNREPSEGELRAGLSFIDTYNQPDPKKGKKAMLKPKGPSPWTYGYVAYDGKSQTYDAATMKPFPYHTSRVMQGDAEYPDKKNGLGWTRLTPEGGHAGGGRNALVRRWTSPVTGMVEIAGSLNHGAEQGNGIRAAVYGPKGKIKQWVSHNAKVETLVGAIEVKQGDALDFVVDAIGDGYYDGFQWIPVVVVKGERKMLWSSKRGFPKPKKTMAGKIQPGEFGPWQSYAQVLLMSNEFVFIQ
ncbi:MAG: DUF1553 domain-containing protein [Verrucomicrobia bacterium]|nr:DUF1553 domain-containing protein [Verrucomicrobiota bacterium]